MTRQLVLTLLTATILIPTFGQQYSYEKIIGTADSIVKGNLDTQLLKYFKRDSGDIKYEFKKDNWRKYKTRYGQIRKNEITKGQFSRTYIYYSFTYKEPLINSPLYPGYLPGSIFIIFDSNLNLVEQLDFSFIPKYVRDQKPCDFILLDKAIEIAKTDNIKVGIEPIAATLDYYGYLKKYCWVVSSVLKKEPYKNSMRGEADTVTIDAVSGEILVHEVTYFGPMH